jgi:Mrp family chromosome partitioning ATPase
MSRPPALDPDAERWASRFETMPPPVDVEAEEPRRKRSGRWKTQVMGSMVPLEASSLREERQPDSIASVPPQVHHVREQAIEPSALAHIEQFDVQFGWTPQVESNGPLITPLRDAVLQQAGSHPLRLAVTGDDSHAKANVAASLALALSGAGARVLLVEADFDSPQLHQVLALAVPGGSGFSQQLAARRGDGRARPWNVMRCSATLQVLAEGRLRSPGLTLSEDFVQALGELSPSYQVTVIHAPRVGLGGDLAILDAVVQGAIVTKAGIAPSVRFGPNPLRALL